MDNEIIDIYFYNLILKQKTELLQIDDKYFLNDFKRLNRLCKKVYYENQNINENLIIAKDDFFIKYIDRIKKQNYFYIFDSIQDKLKENYYNIKISEFEKKIKTIQDDNIKIEMIKNINKIFSDIENIKIKNLKELITDKNKDIIDNKKSNCIMSNYRYIDNEVMGFSGLNIIGARPSMGKTIFTLNIALEMSMELEKKGLIFSFDDNENQIISNIISRYTKIESKKIQNNILTDYEKELVDLVKNEIKNNIQFVFQYLDIFKIQNIIENEINNIDYIIIDYLQLIKHDRRNQVAEYEHITATLREISHRYDVPIFLLSQLNDRDDKNDKQLIHGLGDLKGAGSIEQDANIVIFLEGKRKENIRIINIAKNKSGRISRHILIHFDWSTYSMKEFENGNII